MYFISKAYNLIIKFPLKCTAILSYQAMYNTDACRHIYKPKAKICKAIDQSLMQQSGSIYGIY